MKQLIADIAERAIAEPGYPRSTEAERSDLQNKYHNSDVKYSKLSMFVQSEDED